MGSRPPVDPRMSLAGDVTIITAAVLLATTFGHGWSWLPFVWGVLLGPTSVAFAYFSTQAFSRSLVKSAPDQQFDVEAQMRDVWSKYRVTYFSLVVLGGAVGIVAARTHEIAIDTVATVLWVGSGVIPPIVVWPILKRRTLSRLPGRAH